MKGQMVVIEACLAGVILVLLFLFFFPQYAIKTQWSDTLLQSTVQDALITIDRQGKTYELATDSASDFDQYMNNIFSSEQTGAPLVWWKTINPTGIGFDTEISYFKKSKQSTIVDVEYIAGEYTTYTFTLSMGYVF